MDPFDLPPLPDQPHPILLEIHAAVLAAAQRVDAAERGDQPWTLEGEEEMAYFIVSWGVGMLGRIAEGKITVEELQARKEEAPTTLTRLLQAPWN